MVKEEKERERYVLLYLATGNCLMYDELHIGLPVPRCGQNVREEKRILALWEQ